MAERGFFVQDMRFVAPPHMEGFVSWFEQSRATYGDMVTETVPVTDSDRWKFEMVGEQVGRIVGAHFEIRGSLVTRYNHDGSISLRWLQPGIHHSGTTTEVPINGENKELTFDGFLGAVFNSKGEVLLTLGQEPYADSEKKVLLRTFMQASVTKFTQVLNGEEDKDPMMYLLFQSIGIRGFTDIVNQKGFDLFVLPYADANRVDGKNIGFAITIGDLELEKKLEAGGRNRWCTLEEAQLAARTGNLNGHTTNVIACAAGFAIK